MYVFPGLANKCLRKEFHGPPRVVRMSSMQEVTVDLACIFMGVLGRCGSAAAHLEAGHIWTALLMCDPPMQVNPPLEAPAWSRAYEFCVWLICFFCQKKLS